MGHDLDAAPTLQLTSSPERRDDSGRCPPRPGTHYDVVARSADRDDDDDGHRRCCSRRAELPTGSCSPARHASSPRRPVRTREESRCPDESTTNRR
ncbi:hypothetical protein MPTK1_3g00480 [Marchantia polymorpha subsp. ruderalis]|uniref:Uncharacterized protein n=2 Tax=Marchantia polymorpha TaxID=3197 RepID=A0AAF6AVW7_MARPO|nr:hypothetical protein MARPO_0007s0044 [Marchantia polymorpha]BBN03901.1 hypothetical protein Mp_3g00480 [Marchantia polymorpha subsp. ruderalis]|eukprot:PTQ47589.1 hypothetical protein MARPO_0007s0044 [Marchantia polymorpha]